MADLPPLPPGETRFAQLITALGRKDPRVNERAAEMFCTVGKPVVSVLVQEAIAKRQAKLVDRWGRGVTGDVKLDQDGFPLE